MNISANLDPGGAPSDVSAMGKTKTVTIDTPFTGVATIETQCGANWVAVPGLRFSAPGSVTVEAALNMVRVAGAPGGAPSISMTADDAGATFVTLPSAGTTVDTTVLGSFNTITCTGLSAGSLLKVQTSDDGANWADLVSFQTDSFVSKTFVANNMRVQYNGTGTPSICVGAVNEFPETASSVFTFAPGSVADGRLYSDWAALMADFGRTPGYKRVIVSDQFGAGATPIIPAKAGGGRWDMDFSEIHVYNAILPTAANSAVLHIADGALFDNLNALTARGAGKVLNENQTDIAVILRPNAAAPVFGGFILKNLFVVSLDATTKPFFGIGDGLNATLRMEFGGLFASAAPVLQIGLGSTLTADYAYQGTIQQDTLVSLDNAWTVDPHMPSSPFQKKSFSPLVNDNLAEQAGLIAGGTVNLHDVCSNGTQYQFRSIDDTFAGVANYNDFLLANAAAGQVNIPFGFAATHDGQEIQVKKANVGGANNIVLTPQAGETIEGGASFTILAAVTNLKCVRFVSDGGTNWMLAGDF